ncbi:hypothetical protein [Tenacibaculum finnmarkense]|uniref:hypothetical protein n=1 Tax=Tenacibaculum finnmarkense TaxID=2781243 RepID=UPI001EFA915C|nr:hypothetical protein [Tenacibaculum finnmarkense]MCG8796599.1 hypothetical protein [Tenacibaculum finnmarkense]MCG8798931.1 hypothetical protein [Tenacibaculum finnmarkense]
MTEKFTFPNAGIHIVSHKIGEADYFLTKLKETHSWDNEYNYIFSAYVSSLRSITFTLQFVMRKYPEFDEWYKIRQERLRKSEVAKSFVEFRNHAQKTGVIPIAKERSIFEGIFYDSDQFYVPTNSEIKSVPNGNVIDLSERCLIEVLEVVAECYKDFDVYIDPRVLFTQRALEKLNWTIEDLEEFVGMPKGYTDMDYEDTEMSNDEIRLKLLRKQGGDETLQIYIDKYLVEK